MKRVSWPSAADLKALTKPTIASTSVIMTAGAMGMAPGSLPMSSVVLTLLGVGFSVGSANALNQIWERDTDALMRRTRNRPLASGRMTVPMALALALGLGALGIAMVAVGSNLRATLVTTVALVGYVLVYTPLKKRTAAALYVGAVPGALPPLIGWAASTDSFGAPGLVLTAVLFVWQMPHFIAIALMYAEDYARGGILVLPNVHGAQAARWQSVVYASALVPMSLLLVAMNLGGRVYGAAVLLVGVGMLAVSVSALLARDPARWDRRVLWSSLVYLPVGMLALAIDVALR